LPISYPVASQAETSCTEHSSGWDVRGGLLATPTPVRAFILNQQQDIETFRSQFTALATELDSLRQRIRHSSRNST
jgi:hypothetical protein